MTAKRFDVIVVGGGVVGAAAAAALSQGGFRTALVERGEAPAAFDATNYDLRVYALSPSSARFLARLEAWPRIAAGRLSPYERMRVWEREPAQALEFRADEVRVPQLGYIVENKLLLSAIWQQMRDVTFFERVGVASWNADVADTHLRLTDGTELEARLLIAADGADSTLREQAGIRCASWPYPQQAMVCHVETELPHQHTAWQRFMPTGPLAFLPLADGRCSIVWSSSECWMLQTLEDAPFLSALTAASQGVLGELRRCTHRAVFPLRLLHAEEYVRDRLALVGDAAHVIHPLAGQGVNLGLADVEALVDVLLTARREGRDIGRLRMLKRYERARRADTLDMLVLTEGLYRIFGESPLPAALRSGGLEAVQRLQSLKNFFVQRALRR